MVNQSETLKRLNKEKDYEEKISSDLTLYCLASIDSISALSKKEKEKILKNLKHIRDESLEHMHAFEKLVHMVINKGEREY